MGHNATQCSLTPQSQTSPPNITNLLETTSNNPNNEILNTWKTVTYSKSPRKTTTEISKPTIINNPNPHVEEQRTKPSGTHFTTHNTENITLTNRFDFLSTNTLNDMSESLPYDPTSTTAKPVTYTVQTSTTTLPTYLGIPNTNKTPT